MFIAVSKDLNLFKMNDVESGRDFIGRVYIRGPNLNDRVMQIPFIETG